MINLTKEIKGNLYQLYIASNLGKTLIKLFNSPSVTKKMQVTTIHVRVSCLFAFSIILDVPSLSS